MGVTLADVTSQGRGEILRAWLNNLGVTESPGGTVLSMGLGELEALIADNAAATGAAQGMPGLAPASVLAQSIPRFAIGSQAIAPASGALWVAAVYLSAGTVINSVTWVSGSTAGATLNHQWGVLANSAYTVVAVSADGTSGAIGANAAITYTFAAAYTVPTSGIYYMGVMVTNNSGTQPTAAGIVTGNVATNTIPPIVAGISNTGATTPVALGATLTTPTPNASILYMYLQ